MLGMVLAPLAAAIFGLSMVLVRKGFTDSGILNAVFMVNATGNVILWPLALLFTDLSGVNFEGVLLFAIAGILAPGVARLLMYKGMTVLGISINQSIFGIYPLYSSVFAVLFLKESLSTIDWIGIICIVVGVVFITRSSDNHKTSQKKFSKGGLIYPLVSGLLVAVSHIIRKNGLNIYNAPMLGVAIGYVFSLLIYLPFRVLFQTTQHSSPLRKDFRIFWKASVGLSIGWILSFYALSYGKVSIVPALFQMEPLFVVFFAYIYLRKLEHIHLRLILNTCIVVFGVALLVI